MLRTTPQIVLPKQKKYSGTSRIQSLSGLKYDELCSKGHYGFLLPEEQILDTGAELFSAVKAVAHHITEEAEETLRI